MNKKQVKSALVELVDSWSVEYQRNARPVVKEILRLIDAGVPVSKAINQAMNKFDFAGANKAALENSLFMAAAKGYGILPEIVAEPSKAAIIGKLNKMPWAPDGMNLSKRLHKLDRETRSIINDTIKQAMKEGANVVKLSRELFDGYGYGNQINEADLPKYLKELRSASRRLANTVNDQNADKEFQKLIRDAERKSGGSAGVKTRALNAAYKQLLNAAESRKPKAVEKAAWVATQEKARYHAERIARTEIAKAWADGFLADKLADEDVIGFKWRLSTAHKFYDICDFHATANLYGLGSGVYPRDKMPPQPAHPHCTCHLSEVYDGEFDGLTRKKSIDASGQKFFDDLSDAERKALLGAGGAEQWSRGEKKWQNSLINWSGHENPASRFKKSDFKTNE
ncbi:MAG: hypothetical protein A2008_12375 [Candidatus Wallbacteria bacterium GWC2_49_35]|uniref:Phage head morphogenesis domain-containing protein n=1 Tax=Candidatus Wallbacteria bacterium GWC2_49_35 TaxID=1817813 RepID=A0A1F7WZQ8_9BACT|nr:MAG: hypothetical protein A2008_12375 [Candidatus Wallbacteria bacterium GWC2_49_35]